MPFIVFQHGLQNIVSPEGAKAQLARFFRQNNKVRKSHVLDELLNQNNEKLQRILHNDNMQTSILEYISPSVKDIIF
jgi:hypothetical protein